MARLIESMQCPICQRELLQTRCTCEQQEFWCEECRIEIKVLFEEPEVDENQLTIEDLLSD